jgi:hypothetical protein
MTDREYYLKEMARVNFQGEFPAKVEFYSEDGNSRTLNINKTSAQAIIDVMTDFIATTQKED